MTALILPLPRIKMRTESYCEARHNVDEIPTHLMIVLHNRMARGHTRTGWLDSRHTFSFGQYHDPNYMGFRTLRVINEDRVIPGAGFPTHSHRDMEIVTYVLAGELAHKDSLGTGSVIRPGELQRMTAGTGIQHSEFNHSTANPVHLLQVWILPEREGLPPSYEQKRFDPALRRGRFQLVGDRTGRGGAITIHQDVGLYLADLRAGDGLSRALGPGRHAWLQVLRGAIAVDDDDLKEGDAAAFSGEAAVAITASADAEIMLFDLA
jgi:quercetin 2,3-dioxygenase